MGHGLVQKRWTSNWSAFTIPCNHLEHLKKYWCPPPLWCNWCGHRDFKSCPGDSIMQPGLKTTEIYPQICLHRGAKIFETGIIPFIITSVQAFIQLSHSFHYIQFIQYLWSTYFVFVTELGAEMVHYQLIPKMKICSLISSCAWGFCISYSDSGSVWKRSKFSVPSSSFPFPLT